MIKWNPNDYHQNSSHQQKWAGEILIKMALKGDERILDLGCGDGRITTEVARQVPKGKVVGLDSSPEMIEFAQKKYLVEKRPNLCFQLGNAQLLDIQEEFDWVVSFACLHWIIDHRPVLKGIRQSLRPGGRILLQFGGKGNAAPLVQTVTGVIARPRWADYFVGFTFPWGFYSPDEYRLWMAEIDLVPISLQLIPKNQTVEGRQGLADSLQATWLPYWQRIPADLQQQFFAEIVEDYVASHPIDADGLIHVPMARLQVEAMRGTA